VILAAITVALTMGAPALPSEAASAMVDDFAQLCMGQATRFPTASALARARGWTEGPLTRTNVEFPELKDKLLFSPRAPRRMLFVGMQLSALGKQPNTACGISLGGTAFGEIADALTAKLGAPTNRNESEAYALWKTPQTRRVVVVAKSLVGKSDDFSVAAIDFIEGDGSK
jgi:hypothetical protein